MRSVIAADMKTKQTSAVRLLFINFKHNVAKGMIKRTLY